MCGVGPGREGAGVRRSSALGRRPGTRRAEGGPRQGQASPPGAGAACERHCRRPLPAPAALSQSAFLGGSRVISVGKPDPSLVYFSTLENSQGRTSGPRPACRRLRPPGGGDPNPGAGGRPGRPNPASPCSRRLARQRRGAPASGRGSTARWRSCPGSGGGPLSAL